MRAILECIYNNSYDLPEAFIANPSTFHTRVYAAADYFEASCVSVAVLEAFYFGQLGDMSRGCTELGQNK